MTTPEMEPTTNNASSEEAKRPLPAMPFDPIQMLAAVMSALASECECRTCVLLRKVGSAVADALAGVTEEVAT